MKITKRTLEQATGYSRYQIERWAAEFLERNPLVGQGLGRRRYYSFDQAVKIWIGGHLVSDLKFKIEGAQKVLNDLFPWLERKGWLPSHHFGFTPLKRTPGYFVDSNSINYPGLVVYIAKYNDQFEYRVKEILKQEFKPDPEDSENVIITESYRQLFLGDSRPFYKEEGQVLYFSDMVKGLANLLSGQSRRKS